MFFALIDKRNDNYVIDDALVLSLATMASIARSVGTLLVALGRLRRLSIVVRSLARSPARLPPLVYGIKYETAGTRIHTWWT